MDKQIIYYCIITLIFILSITLLMNYNFLPEKINKNEEKNIKPENIGVVNQPPIMIDHKQVLDELNVLIRIQANHTLQFEVGIDHPLYINDKHFKTILTHTTTEINNLMSENLKKKLLLIFSEEGLQRYIIYLLYPLFIEFSNDINIPK